MQLPIAVPRPLPPAPLALLLTPPLLCWRAFSSSSEKDALKDRVLGRLRTGVDWSCGRPQLPTPPPDVLPSTSRSSSSFSLLDGSMTSITDALPLSDVSLTSCSRLRSSWRVCDLRRFPLEVVDALWWSGTSSVVDDAELILRTAACSVL